MPRRAEQVVGNDVVDLRDPEAQPSALHPRFAARVLAPAERARVSASAEPVALLWTHFAAKEAAFKAVSRLRPGLVFAHQAFEVDADLGLVRFDGLVLHLRVDRDDERVHALAFLGDAPPDSCVARWRSSPSDDARRLLRELLAPRLACDARDLSVVRKPDASRFDGFGPPHVERAGVPVPLTVSLSHHGRFAACAATSA